jgi:Bacterial protein of unknown function (DUF916)
VNLLMVLLKRFSASGLMADIDRPDLAVRQRPRQRRLQLHIPILSALLVVLTLTLWAPGAYAASSTTPSAANKAVVTFGTQTATATKPDGRGYYSFAATPGAQVLDHVAVINYSNKTVTLTLRAADAINTPQGGFAVIPINERSKDIGTWIALPASDLSVTIPPRSNLIVPFLVEVPKNASPGDHIGAITATLASFVVSKSGQRVRLLQTTGTRVFLRVSGPLHPGFAVQNLKINYTGTANPAGTGQAVLTYTVRNIGNVALGGRQTVYITGLFGTKRTAVHVAEVQLLLPGNSVNESVRISGILPEFRDTGHVSISPLYVPGSVQPASGPYTATVSFWAIPWTLLAIVVILILVIWLLIRRRRRGKRPDKGPGRPAGPAAAAADDGDQVARDLSPNTAPQLDPEAPGTGEPAPVASTKSDQS